MNNPTNPIVPVSRYPSHKWLCVPVSCRGPGRPCIQGRLGCGQALSSSLCTQVETISQDGGGGLSMLSIPLTAVLLQGDICEDSWEGGPRGLQGGQCLHLPWARGHGGIHKVNIRQKCPKNKKLTLPYCRHQLYDYNYQTSLPTRYQWPAQAFN